MLIEKNQFCFTKTSDLRQWKTLSPSVVLVFQAHEQFEFWSIIKYRTIVAQK